MSWRWHRLERNNGERMANSRLVPTVGKSIADTSSCVRFLLLDDNNIIIIASSLGSRFDIGQMMLTCCTLNRAAVKYTPAGSIREVSVNVVRSLALFLSHDSGLRFCDLSYLSLFISPH